MKRISKLIMGLTIVLGLVGGLGTEANAEVIRTNDYKSQVVNFKENLPTKLKETADSINIEILDSENYNKKLMKLYEFDASQGYFGNTFFNLETKECFLYVKDFFDIDEEYNTFTHELFHALDDVNDFKYTSSDDWFLIYNKEKGYFANEYFDTSIKEFFAESGSTYLKGELERLNLKEKCPETYAYIESILNGQF